MRNTLKVAILSGALLAGIAGSAAAGSNVRLSIGLGIPAPVAYYPAPVYYPAPGPVVYAPAPAVYYAPPVAYPAPVRITYGSYPYWRGYGHRHWR